MADKSNKRNRKRASAFLLFVFKIYKGKKLQKIKTNFTDISYFVTLANVAGNFVKPRS